MAPRKAKNQAKKSNIKIKGKTNPQKCGLKKSKNRKLNNHRDDLTWYSKSSPESDIGPIDSDTDWLTTDSYKKDFSSSSSSEADSTGYADFIEKEPGYKTCVSDASEDCICYYDKYPENKFGILKRQTSSNNTIVAKYLKSGLDHVASFIVESALRFGEQHGVVVPDKNSPNVYEITRPENKRFTEKCRRIRFQIPERTKKLVWESREGSSECHRKAAKSLDYPVPSLNSMNDSLEEIIPLLKRLKKYSEVNLHKLESSSEPDHICPARERKRLLDKEKNRGRERQRLREISWDRERLREPEEKRDRSRDRSRTRSRPRSRERERVREKIKKLQALGRLKSVDALSDEKSQTNEYSLRRHWKKFRQDSLELGRQRLRPSTCPRKTLDLSQSPNY